MTRAGDHEPEAPKATWSEDGSKSVLSLSGDWYRGQRAVIEGVDSPSWPDEFRADELGGFDSMLPSFLLKLLRADGIEEPSFEGLPEDLRQLMELAVTVPERIEAKAIKDKGSGIHVLGGRTRAAWSTFLDLLEFIGDAVRSVLKFFIGKAKFRKDEFWVIVQECGVGALPIVSLISFLIGMILAFVGNVQLASFGASLYVADLVGIAMVREMGVMMTAVIMSGRTGAAFAATIGSMNANQEIDALKTFGFNPFDYLVLPRIFALFLMMPLLTVYANIVGILGGMVVAAGVGITPSLFLTEMLTMVDLTTASLGVIKSFFFGITIAIAGCFQGMRSGNSSAAVGQATTRAVVASITAIIVLDSLFAVIFTILEI